MTSEVGICNAALIQLGVATITSLTEATKSARLCNQRYATLRDAELRMLKWNFAITRVELALLATTPNFEYSNEFQLPSDCIRFLKTDDELVEYKIEDDLVRTDRSTVKIQYVRQITDPNKFDPLFAEALAAKIAMKIGRALTDSSSIMNEVTLAYATAIEEAKAMDALETGSPDTFEADAWINSRY